MLDVDRPLQQRYQLALARQEIEYLRRLYGQATDALGKTDDPAARQFGIDTYRRIFSADVAVRVTGSATSLSGNGPDAWVEVVTSALQDYASTQHLIGTQIVTFSEVEFDDDNITQGDAMLKSYLHAWHVWPDRKLRLVMGTYTDRVRWNPDVGWQIYDMTLDHTSTEHRMLGDLT